MPNYQIYLVDPMGHVVQPPAIITCDTDGEAVQTAEAIAGGQALEVWEYDRRVMLIEPMKHDHVLADIWFLGDRYSKSIH
jgi:hypothetical protein